MAAQPLTAPQIDEALTGLPGWKAEGDRLSRVYKVGRHMAGAAMAVHIAAIQDELNHHAELSLGYNTLGITVNTHSAGGRITDLDVTLARRITAIATGHGAS